MTSTLTHIDTRPSTIPAEVRVAFLLWMGALAAGAIEIALHDVEIAGLAMRLSLYAVVTAIALGMRAGRNWARLTLAIGLGIFGTLSLVVEPVTWLLDGNSLIDAVRRTDLTGALIATSRILHVLCVWGAVVFMFRPRANTYFKRRNVS
ncbi:hypothetical protein [Micromonospora echinaurantiaca]|uniref:hypothetical protein n=1 Tax=Micromonospora echinaurantiaca TaxID=47857 RepID=UPI003435F9F9